MDLPLRIPGPGTLTSDIQSRKAGSSPKGERTTIMPDKTIDVTLATIRNVGPKKVSPDGVILCQRVRSVDDEQVFQSEALYQKSSGQPMHPNGATHIPPGESLSYNVTKRLTLHYGDPGEVPHLDEMLLFRTDLTQSLVDDLGTLHPTEPYQGDSFHKVRFDDITGFHTVVVNSNVNFGGEFTHKINLEFTVTLLEG
jgi:hypothetical protein